VLQQAGVPDPVEVVWLAIKEDVPLISTLAAVVLVMQRLVHVTGEVDHELERLRLRRPVCVRVAQDPEEILGLGDDAIPVRALPPMSILESANAMSM